MRVGYAKAYKFQPLRNIMSYACSLKDQAAGVQRIVWLEDPAKREEMLIRVTWQSKDRAPAATGMKSPRI